MSNKTYALISAIIFALVALAHVWRVATHAVVTVNGADVPFGPSWAGLIVAGILAICGFRVASRN
jgi:hypothetical protein